MVETNKFKIKLYTKYIDFNVLKNNFNEVIAISMFMLQNKNTTYHNICAWYLS